MAGGINRTDRFARRGIAVLAEHGQETRFDVRVFAFPISLDTNPVDLPTERGLLFARDGHVVFGAASDHACFAAGAFVEINDHSPMWHILLNSTFRVCAIFEQALVRA